MNDLELARTLRKLRRTVMMLEGDLRQQYMNAALIADIDEQMERGIASEPRCERLRAPVDTLRENTLTPRPELFADTIRACEELQDAIEEVLSVL